MQFLSKLLEKSDDLTNNYLRIAFCTFLSQIFKSASRFVNRDMLIRTLINEHYGHVHCTNYVQYGRSEKPFYYIPIGSFLHLMSLRILKISTACSVLNTGNLVLISSADIKSFTLPTTTSSSSMLKPVQRLTLPTQLLSKPYNDCLKSISFFRNSFFFSKLN